MREIKFRAWDGNRMFFKSMVEMIFNDDAFELQDYPLMQYTGLKDKNGKEIYEGDIIIEFYNGQPKRSYPKYKIIEWGFHSDHSSYMSQLGWNLWEEEEYGVVGNIYENPLLLKHDK